jgi:hypothetical protein
MARAMVTFLRQPDASWRAVGVWLGTRTALTSRFDPAAQLHDWAKRIHDYARPPSLTPGGPPGTWEDWIEYGLDALSNGHDLMEVEVPPELTADELYAREVLGLPEAKRKGFRLQGIANATVVQVDGAVAAQEEGRA